MMSSLEEHAGQNVTDEDSDCAYDSDYGVSEYYSSDGSIDSEWGSDYEDGPKPKTKGTSRSRIDLEPEDLPWRRNQTFRSLDSTLSGSATGHTEGSGPFYWIAVSDLMRHCAKTCRGDAYESLQQGISQFKLKRTWKYWLCYLCHRIFHDEIANQSHFEATHAERIDVPYDVYQYQMLPSLDNPSEPCLEDSITIDETCDHFLVDSTLFHHMSSAEDPSEAKRGQCIETVTALRAQLSSARCLFDLRRKYCTDLEVVNAIEPVLFNAGQPAVLLVSWLHKLSSMDQFIDTTQQLQCKFLSQLLDRAHGKTSGLFSNISVSEAFEEMRRELISELVQLDKINRVVHRQIVLLKHYLSNLSIADYRTKIVPAVRSFLHAKFDFNRLGVLGCDKIEDLLSSLTEVYIVPEADSFSVSVQSSGKVIINSRRNKSLWGFAFIRCDLNFDGLWPYPGGKLKITGNFKFGGFLPWGSGPFQCSAEVTPDNREAYAIMNSQGLELEYDLGLAIGDKLLRLKEEYFMIAF